MIFDLPWLLCCRPPQSAVWRRLFLRVVGVGTTVLVSGLFSSGCSSVEHAPVDEAGGAGSSALDGAAGASGGVGGSDAGADGDAISRSNQWLSTTTCPDQTSGFAEDVVAVSWGAGEDFGREAFPEQILGGPRGGGCCAGSLDVVALGDGGSITLGFGARGIVDGPGTDFLVFENPFSISGQEEDLFFELGRVEVSSDGKEWFAFPCDPERPAASSCAGHSPVLSDIADEDSEPFDPQKAGGDAFDLADVGLLSAHFVRITDVEGDAAGFDLDAVAVVNGQCL